MPQISLIIPVYKAAKYLRQCLDSVKSQSFTDWECLLVDDGSPDNSGAICDEYASIDDRFRVFHKENGGVSSARNYGMSKSIAPWITFVDADDFLEPTYLWDMSHNINADMVVTGIKRTGTKNDDIIYPSTLAVKALELSRLWNIPLKAFPFWWCWGKLFRKNLIDSYNIRFCSEMFYSEDTLFVFQYVRHCQLIATTSVVGYIHYCEPNRPLKFKMNASQLLLHSTYLLNALQNIEVDCNIRFKNIRYSILRRLCANFLTNLFNIEKYSSFNKELSSFRKYLYYKEMLVAFQTGANGKLNKRRFLITLLLSLKINFLVFLIRKHLCKSLISNLY